MTIIKRKPAFLGNNSAKEIHFYEEDYFLLGETLIGLESINSPCWGVDKGISQWFGIIIIWHYVNKSCYYFVQVIIKILIYRVLYISYNVIPSMATFIFIIVLKTTDTWGYSYVTDKVTVEWIAKCTTAI